MKPGIIVTLLLIAAGLSLAIYAFVQNTAPFVTIADARAAGDRHVFVSAELVKESVQTNPHLREVRFTLRDEKTGETMPVFYRGFVPENMSDAPRVVVGGKYQEGQFRCSEIQLKCPSKYQGIAKDPNVKISADR